MRERGCRLFCGAQAGRRSERGRSDEYRPPPTNRIRMIGTFRTGRWAAALSAVIALFVSPAQAGAQSAPRVQQTFAAAPVQAAAQAPVPTPTSLTPTPAQVAADTTAALAAPVQRALKEIVDLFVDSGNQDDEQLCLAKAVYF